MTNPYTRKTNVRVGQIRVGRTRKWFRVLEMNGAKTWCLVQGFNGPSREVTTGYVEKCPLLRRKS